MFQLRRQLLFLAALPPFLLSSDYIRFSLVLRKFDEDEEKAGRPAINSQYLRHPGEETATSPVVVAFSTLEPPFFTTIIQPDKLLPSTVLALVLLPISGRRSKINPIPLFLFKLQ